MWVQEGDVPPPATKKCPIYRSIGSFPITVYNGGGAGFCNEYLDFVHLHPYSNTGGKTLQTQSSVGTHV